MYTITTLCLDFGNTRQKAALFLGREQVDVFYFTDNLLSSLEEVLEKWRPDRTILSSVINHPPSVEEMLVSKTAFHLLEAGKSKLPFETFQNFSTTWFDVGFSGPSCGAK
jgi:type III pantothenate kinase